MVKLILRHHPVHFTNPQKVPIFNRNPLTLHINFLPVILKCSDIKIKQKPIRHIDRLLEQEKTTIDKTYHLYHA